MTIRIFMSLFLTFIVFYGFRYFFDSKYKYAGVKRLIIDVAVTTILASIVFWIISSI